MSRSSVIVLVASAILSTPLIAPAATSLYVSYGGSTILQVAPNGTVSTFATGFSEAFGLAFDSSGNLYTADLTEGTVDKISPGGVVSTFATGLAAPERLAFDSSGNLYVSNDYHLGTINKITPGGVVSLFASGVASSAGMAFDQSDNLFIGNGGDIIHEITPAGVISTFATGLTISPIDMAFDSSGDLYTTSYPGIVSKITPAGAVSTFANLGNQTLAQGLAFDSSGNLYIGDVYNNGAIYELPPSGGFATFAMTHDVPFYIAISPVPEPTSIALLACGAGLLIWRRSRSNR